MYGAAFRDATHLDDVHGFVTSNYLDFSTPNGDRRAPHPDLAQLFGEGRSGYFYGIEGLDAALVNGIGEASCELAEETEFVGEEPRTLAEILEAE